LHIHFLDTYQGADSPIHRADPRVKFILALAFILTTALMPFGAWPIYILLFSILISAVVLSTVGVGYVLRRSALALPFLLAALPLIFITPGSALFSLNFGGWQASVSLEGLERFLSITFKSWVSVQAAILLTATTPFPDLLSAMRAVGIPRLLVTIFGLMWRYLFVLGDEAMRLIRARAARSGEADVQGLRRGGSLAWRATTAGGMAGNLFLRSLERSDRIYVAMLSRGYDGEVRTIPLSKLTLSNWAVMIAGGVVLGLLLILSFLSTG
jgi:cobalt/nickel transport system permease protein